MDSTIKSTPFSIDCLLGQEASETDTNDDEIVDVEEDHEGALVRPEPSRIMADHVQGQKSNEDMDEDAAIAAALQSSLFYSQHPSNFLYSQWLAARNTSALFGLQGN